MTILYDPTYTATLAAAEETNNPFFLWDDLSDTYTAPDGTEANGPIENLSTPNTNKYVYPSADGSGDYRIEFTTTGAITCVGIASHNLGKAGATVRVEYWDGAAWQDSGAGVASPSDDQAICWRFASRNPAKWSLFISGAPSEQPAIAVLIPGVEMIFPMRLYQGYAPTMKPTNYRREINVSRSGHYMGGAAVPVGSSTSPSIDLLPESFVYGATFQSFITHYNEGKPLFWAWRPTKYGHFHYGWNAGASLVPVNSGPKDRMSVSFELGLYDDP